MRIGETQNLGISRQLADTQRVVSRALERLSSGKRINSPLDDVAAYSQVQGIQAQIRGLEEVSLGISQANSLLQTSSSAISTLTELVQRMREIAVQGSNSLLNSNDRANLQNELTALNQEYQRITNTTEFAGLSLLSGAESEISFLLDDSGNDFELDLQNLQAAEVFEKTIGTGQYQLEDSITLGSGDRFIESADLNGDGIVDAVSGGGNSGIFTTLLGDGEGNLTISSTLNVGVGVDDLKLGDVNGDQILDLVSTDATTDSVFIAIGNGDGSFQAATTFSVDNAFGLQLADFDNDGDLDVATTALSTGDSVTVSLNDGSGNFTVQDSISVGNEPQLIETGDINGDGIVDIVTADYEDQQLSVLIGLGDGSFEAAVTVGLAATFPKGLVVEDFDGDGKDDIGVILDDDIFEANDDKLEILMSNGDGTFDSVSSDTLGRIVRGLEVGDLNNDGIVDLFAHSISGGSYVSVFLGNGDGSFQAEQSNAFGATVGNDFAVVDLDGDGVLDVIGLDSSPGEAFTFLGGATKVTALADLSVSSQTEAQRLIGILDGALENLNTAQSDIASQATRLSFALENNLLQVESLTEAKSVIEDADFAVETANLVSAQIQQQAQIAALSQSNLQMQVVIELLNVL